MLWLAALVTLAPLDRIHQIGHDHLTVAPSEDLVAIGACTRPDAAEREQIRTHVASWIARSVPADSLDNGPDFRFGCDELTGTLVDVHIDTTGEHRGGYWWTLRVAPDRVERVVEVTGMSSMDWMEWESETSASTVALADLDGDGRLDVITARDDHEGGEIHHQIELSAVTTRTGKRTVIASARDDIEAVPGLPSLVVEITRDQRRVYRCIGKDLTLGTCPEIATARMRRRALDAASELAYAKDLPDREQLAADLTALGIFDLDLLSAAPPTMTAQHAQRDVERWLAEQRGERTDEELGAIAAADEAAYELALDVALGDAPCGPTTKAMLEAAQAGHASGVATPACGSYVWVTWVHDTTRVQQLVHVRGGVARPILRGEDPASEDPTWEPEPMLTGAFHEGGAAIVRAGRVDIVHGDDVVANQTGIDYTVRGPVITDGDHYVHAGAKGLEPVNDVARALIARHEALLAALDADTPTADQLRLLGAPAWLVEEVHAAAGW